MTYLTRILVISVFVTLSACSGANSELEEEQAAISEDLKSKFSNTTQLVYSGDTLMASKEVLDYYKSVDFIPVWIRKDSLTKSGNDLLGMIQNSKDYGLLPEMYHYSTISKMKDSSLLDTEMMLTNAFYLLTTHITLGCVDQTTYQYVWKKDSLNFKLEDELKKVVDGSNVVELIESHQPKFWEYQQLQKGLASFLDLYPLDTNHYSIPAFKDDSVKCYIAAKEALIGHAFLDSTVTDDSVFIEKLKVFQKYGGLKDDAVVGKWTGRALEKSNLDRFYQAALSLEKWRWKSAYPKKYIRVNIPEFALYFFDGGEVKRKHRVVVGAYLTQTPEFKATMERMITNPFWSVPYSIASTEILYGARKDSAYFSKRGYKVFGNDGTQVDPKSVNWGDVKEGNFRYRVRQDGGGGNSLGRIKFLFPNEHAVFIHDTPSKGLFGNDVRAYSHGCIRLHQPYELAKEIIRLDQNKFQADSLESIITKGLMRTIELNDPFDVYIEYFTATGDSSASIKFHPDIYGRDEKFLKNTFKKFNPQI